MTTDQVLGYEDGRLSIRLEDLPPDILYTIVSKLPPKEVARTSVLSSKWRCMWSTCPRLTFDAVTMCKCNRADLHEHTERFIHEVNAVLQKHRGKVVETLEVRIDLVDSLLVHHLNNWVDFAVSSRTRTLTLDLKPRWFQWDQVDRYLFPFQLLDSGSISRLEHMQLSFVDLKPPSQIPGFPNLRKLYLQLVHASNNGLVHVLSHCCNLEWLCLDRCSLSDELMVAGPLSHLLYLRIDRCKITKIEFHAVNLATFDYEGSFIPIGLNHSLKLQSANIQLDEAVFHHALVSLLGGLPHVQNLTLRIGRQQMEKQWLWGNHLNFSCLKNLQLFMLIRAQDVENVLYSVSFMRATPFIENLEVHFSGHPLWFADVGPRRQDLGKCKKYNYLKNVCITGFKAARGQVELLLHIVENTPALEVLTVNTTQLACQDILTCGGRSFEEAKQIAMTSLSTVLQQNVKFIVI
ncbi:hypothetical protein EJB05_49714 [Eragrostis curvula]|uniref:F-box domain-containing protein n=1 Tax=Eragrostis curvula TaxID=38414 RepID=A0A5J9T5G6_9POAL|nr:hypothetical protein EJB05_49714 [Eragrostis curvula]